MENKKYKNLKPSLLIVGGTRFIEYHLAGKAKKKGWKVTSLSLNMPSKKRNVKEVRYLISDISNLKKLKKKLIFFFNYVINLGGYVNHSFSKKIKKPFQKLRWKPKTLFQDGIKNSIDSYK